MDSKSKQNSEMDILSIVMEDTGVTEAEARVMVYGTTMDSTQFHNLEANSDPVNSFKIAMDILNKSPNPNPSYAQVGDSGFDLRAWLDNPLTLKPLERALVPTGIYIELPQGYEAQLRSRSGCTLKQGLVVLNAPGTIDLFYDGECKVIAANLSNEDIVINNGDRIAQMVITPVLNSMLVTLNFVEQLRERGGRGSKGFGSSGVK